jgi:hypothetical protein
MRRIEVIGVAAAWWRVDRRAAGSAWCRPLGGRFSVVSAVGRPVRSGVGRSTVESDANLIARISEPTTQRPTFGSMRRIDLVGVGAAGSCVDRSAVGSDADPTARTSKAGRWMAAPDWMPCVEFIGVGANPTSPRGPAKSAS